MSNYKRYFKDSLNPVFITFVTYNRLEILIQNIDVLRNSFKYAKNKYNFEIIAISAGRVGNAINIECYND